MKYEDLLRDFINHHYVEGNITHDQMVEMLLDVESYIKQIKELI